MRLYGWVLIQYDWCPYKKRRFGKTQTCTEGRPCEIIERSQPSTSQGEKPQRKPCQNLNLRFLASRTGRKYISVAEASQTTVFCYGSSNKLIQIFFCNSSFSTYLRSRGNVGKSKTGKKDWAKIRYSLQVWEGIRILF